MTALVASLFLGLYLLLPVLVFDKTLAFFVPAKKFTRPRTEELAFGAVTILAPLLLAWLFSHLFWFVGHYPFPLPATAAHTPGDYRTVIMALQSDHFLEAHDKEVWDAVSHVARRQARFLVWMYLLLALQCGLLILLLRKYGAWRKYAFYRRLSAPLIKRVSPWHILFTTFSFDPKDPPEIEVDVVSGGDLFTGHMGSEHYLTNTDGTLNGLLLTQTRRFRRDDLAADRQGGHEKPHAAYWTRIAGDGQFYIPFSTIANINIRYKTRPAQLKSELAATIRSTQDILDALNLDGLAGLEITFDHEGSPLDDDSPESMPDDHA